MSITAFSSNYFLINITVNKNLGGKHVIAKHVLRIQWLMLISARPAFVWCGWVCINVSSFNWQNICFRKTKLLFD